MNFNNLIYEQHFEKNGFAKLETLINNVVLSKLQDLYNTTIKDKAGNTMYSNYHDLSYEENQTIKQRIVAICNATLENLLKDYRVVGASFIIKGSGDQSDSRIHQDWSIVDESRFRSMILWIPLVDVDEKNGCLQVIPGSHIWFNAIRSESINSLFLKFNFLLNPFLIPIPLCKGDAAMFSMKVFHGSKQNLSSQERPAVTITLIEKEAKYIYFHKEQDNNIKVFDCNDEDSYRKTYEFCKGRSQEKAIVLKERYNDEPLDVSRPKKSLHF